ncbi:hypothetical protein M3Y98_00712200 [Aphelenchoides besseyi]|nr:hypothetical protein M3Y98_00702800 [Aphelenchoides besseyi]KAI6180364.1 hypothetical protein M3Y98_00712200 [Aphelenchoides besseyi]KAI6210320.1 hypothetical protein M3Y96_00315500 [Aphelenchoides besseyi]KAI6210411.1 hypothetical protein M3Y96_00325300 [Aphelenchoides besseyi]
MAHRSEYAAKKANVNGFVRTYQFEITCYPYASKHDDEVDSMVYWKPKDHVFGFFNMLEEAVYETEMNKQARMRFLNNVGESLVEDEWRALFRQRHFVVSSSTGEYLKMQNGRATVDLKRVDDEEADECKTKLVNLMIKEIKELKELCKKLKSRQTESIKHPCGQSNH